MMVDRQEVLDSIRERLSDLGYERFEASLMFDRRDAWLRRINDHGSANFTTVVYLQYKPSFRAYSVSFGVVAADLMQQLRQLLSLSTIQHVLRRWRSARPLESPCWNLFDAGRALGWRYLSIPDCDAPEGWKDEFARLRDVWLEGCAHKVVDYPSFARFLLRSDKPFEWWTSDPILRASEIALALTRQGYLIDAIESNLEEAREPVSSLLGDDVNFRQFISTFIKLARQ